MAGKAEKYDNATRQQELEANAFAYELLMPEAWLRKDCAGHVFDIESDPLIHKLARRYDVADAVMIIRLLELKLLRG